MPSSHYDVIVAGAGSMGSATCFFLARQGYSVLGLEQFDTVPHVYGSHAGQSRIIRKAYFEHPGYVPLLERAYTNWQQLEDLTGERVYHPTGLLYYGPREHVVIKGVKEAAMKYGIDVDQVSEKKITPGLEVMEMMRCCWNRMPVCFFPKKPLHYISVKQQQTVQLSGPEKNLFTGRKKTDLSMFEPPGEPILQKN